MHVSVGTVAEEEEHAEHVMEAARQLLLKASKGSKSLGRAEMEKLPAMFKQLGVVGRGDSQEARGLQSLISGVKPSGRAAFKSMSELHAEKPKVVAVAAVAAAAKKAQKAV